MQIPLGFKEIMLGEPLSSARTEQLVGVALIGLVAMVPAIGTKVRGFKSG
jgi:hypothetical protein